MTLKQVGTTCLSLAVLVMLSTLARGADVASPDGQLVVRIEAANGQASYSVAYKGKTVIEPSPLGIETSIGSFPSSSKLEGTRSRKIEEAYTLPLGKVRDVKYQANELVSRHVSEAGDACEIVFRVSDRDVAFAYRLSSKERVRAVITGEKTGFKLPAKATTFITRQAAYGTGWKGTKPSYEEGYTRDGPVGGDKHPRLGYTFPALFRLGDEGWVSISETGVSSKYVGTRLGQPTSEGLYPIAFPERAENAGVGDTSAQVSLPAMTSWKTITVGETLKPIVETTVATDVVEPLYEPSETYKPGRSTWSWLIWQDGATRFDEQKTFIDLAAKLNFEYVLIDALWDTQIGRDRIAELARYGQSKNVSLILWYNSNGAWNDAPQSPRDKMDAAPARDREMAWMRSIGVKGIKVDFFGGDKQATMKLYEDILTDANTYGLHVNFHGATLPRGWQRMYPNYMTSEATLASENAVFSQGFADSEATTSTITPFIRNAVGPMDFGPVYLNKRLSRNQDRGVTRKTTDAFQLATAVLYQSPLQPFGLTPNNLDEQPAGVIEYLRRVPTVWDETRLLDGYPGRFVAIARRAGDSWYVAATNAEEKPKELTVTLPELAGKTATLIRDRPDRAADVEQVSVGADGSVKVKLESGGGAVLFN